MKSAETPTSILVSGRPPKPAVVGAYGGPLLYKLLGRVLGYRSISLEIRANQPPLPLPLLLSLNPCVVKIDGFFLLVVYPSDLG